MPASTAHGPRTTQTTTKTAGATAPMPDRISGLYGITPDWPDGPLFAAVETALQSGLRLLQYRHKTADDATRRRQAMRLRTLCGRHGAQLIVNDDARLA